MDAFFAENLADDRENLKDFLEEAELQQYHELFRDILKVAKVSQLKYVMTEDLAHIGLSKPEQRRYKKIYSKYFPNPYISKIKKLLSSNKKNDLYPHSSFPIDVQPSNENNVKVPTKHIISVEDITINKELGMGQFGVVQQGTWTTGNQRMQVAIKCLGHERMTSNSTEFLKEAAVMHSINHPNIVRLYGVVLHMDSLMLVTELAPLRSLLECLREVGLRSSFPVPNLCDFAEQICDGMTYLENKRLIHRDLAARNILVFNKDKVKISDFGLSRALGVGKDYYQTNYNVNLKLPVAWCAPECILYLRFTSASDVWAFGVCLWEMFTYGFQPWAAFSGQQILEAIDVPNLQRLERPECCPEEYYNTMLQCWSHDPNVRPKFKDLGLRLQIIRPELVQTTTSFSRTEEARRNNLLEYKSGSIITVIGKDNLTKSSMWYGVLPGGAFGIFDSKNTKPYIRPPKSSLSQAPASLSPISGARRSARLPAALRPSSLNRSDAKRHTYTGKRAIERSMISSPQGDMKHTGHVGLDGAYFGDISFMDAAGCPPRQVVTPYKPSEDLEQMPLINPNSPSHLSADASCAPPYPLLSQPGHDINVVNLGDPKPTGSIKKTNLKSDPKAGKTMFKKKAAEPGRPRADDANQASSSKVDEIHEYQEITENDPRNEAAQSSKTDINVAPKSPSITKSYGDFRQSLLDEMESMFRTIDTADKREHSTTPKHLDVDSAKRAHTLHKLEKKKISSYTGTMKPMSAHDQKTLETAVALANEITSRSMHDLDTDQKVPSSPNERSKFHFKFPHISSLHHHHATDDHKGHGNKSERRNFSEEANSVPDIQASITKESKHAYTSLIEEPTQTSSLIPQITKEANAMQLNSQRQLEIAKATRASSTNLIETQESPKRSSNSKKINEVNELLLPPRNTKPKLVDKPRHIRKHPLILPMVPTAELPRVQVNIYQNFMCPKQAQIIEKSDQKAQSQYQNLNTDVNGQVIGANDTNPFKNEQPNGVTGPSVNPFNCFIDTVDGPEPSVVKMEDVQPSTSQQLFKHDDQPSTSKQYFKEDAQHLTLEQFLKEDAQTSTNQQNFKEDVQPSTSQQKFKQDAQPSTVKQYSKDLALAQYFEDDNQISTSKQYYKEDAQPSSSQQYFEEDIQPSTSDQYFKEAALVKDCTDHVSVEDLLEFADQKPCGRQRGIESDEVRIMSKVLKQQVTPDECIEALELSYWNVHYAIKITRVRIAAGSDATLDTCSDALRAANGDVVKASATLVLARQNAATECTDSSE